jgi:hypothetical protein
MTLDPKIDAQLRIARQHLEDQFREIQAQQRKLRRKMWIILFIAIIAFIAGNVLLHGSTGR